MTSPAGHHRKSIRLQGYDYRQAGAYYVTIVTQARACVLGEIVHGEIQLSERGRIADTCWRRIQERFPQIGLGAFIMMPNHVHGILIMHDQQAGVSSPPVVGARHALPLLRERRVEMGIGRLGNWVTRKNEPLSAPGREYTL